MKQHMSTEDVFRSPMAASTRISYDNSTVLVTWFATMGAGVFALFFTQFANSRNVICTSGLGDSQVTLVQAY